MNLHHRHKQRILSLLVTLIILFFAVDLFLLSADVLGSDVALLTALLVAVGLATGYQAFHLEHSHEPHVLVNTLTQAFLGCVVFTSALITIIVSFLLVMDTITLYVLFSAVVLFLTFALLRPFDTALSSLLHTRLGLQQAPEPPRRKKR